VKNNRLLIALVVLIGVGALAFNASRSHQAETTMEAPVTTLPTLKKEQLTEIEIVRPSEPPVVLAKQGDTWALVKPVAAKADLSAVDQVIEKLTTLDITGVTATRKENHARLQVDAEKAIHVKAKGGDKVLLDIYVGMSKGGNTMLRIEGKDTVLGAKGGLRFAFDKEAKQFRDRVISDIDTAEITAMLVESPKGTFKFEKADKTWTQAAKEKPIKDFSDAKVQSLASTLARLRAADFAEEGTTPEAAGFGPLNGKVTFTVKTGEPVVIELGKVHENGREYYTRVTGKDTLFRVSKFTADRMLADATAFADTKKEGEPAAEAPPSMPPGEGMPQELPPEIMEQLKRQLAEQGGHP